MISQALIEFPDGSLYCVGTFYMEEPERIAEMSRFNPNDVHMAHVLKTWEDTRYSSGIGLSRDGTRATGSAHQVFDPGRTLHRLA